MSETESQNQGEFALEAITTDIEDALSDAKAASAASLDAYRVIGRLLTDAKPLLPDGAYLKWAKSKFGFSRQWCSRLTSLARDWALYEEARAWAEEHGHSLKSSDYSVDGALALIRKWQKQSDPEAKDTTDKPKKQTLKELKAELAKAQAELATVKAENERLKAQLASRQRMAPFRTIDNKTKSKAQKMASYWTRGSTPNERANAEGLLRHFAREHGRSFERFLAECGIKCPVDWTSARAA